MQEYKINDFLKLRLENKATNIYVKEELFSKCKYLLVNVPSYRVLDEKDQYTVERAEKYLSRKLEISATPEELGLTPEEEFEGHCSNLQAWVENDYNPRILHSNLAFPLLKKLTEAGDPNAKEIFKTEVIRKFSSKHESVINYLVEEGYFDYLNREEFVSLLDVMDFSVISIRDLIEGIVDYYETQFGRKYLNQILEEFAETSIGEKYYFYLPFMKRLIREGSYLAKMLFKEEITDWVESNDSNIKNYLKREGYLEYLNKEDFKNTYEELNYPKLIYTFEGHIDRVNVVAFSPDGKYLASGGGPFDKTIKLWDLSKGELIRTFHGHNSDINSILFTSDNEYLVSGSWDKTIRIWDISQGELVKTLKGHSSWVRSLAMTQDGEYIISSSGDNRKHDYSIKIWNLSRKKFIRNYSELKSEVNSVALSPNDQYLACGLRENLSKDPTGIVWNYITRELVLTLKNYTKTIITILFSLDGKYLISGSTDGNINKWSMETGELVHTMQGHELHIWDLAFSPDGKYLISSSSDGTVKIWNFESGDLMQTLIGHSSDFFIERCWIYSVTVSPDGKYTASGAMDNKIKVWEINYSKF